MVERYVHWNEDIGEWQLKCVAYTGNNMRKQLDNGDAEKENQVSMINVSFSCSSCIFALEWFIFSVADLTVQEMC